jgi:hypothetical protein
MSASPIRTSEQTDKIDDAMASAQAELENPIKNKTAKVEGVSKASGKPFSIGYSYSDIADILADCRPVLASHGVTIYQVPVINDGRALMLVTRLAKSGQWIEGDYPVCMIGVDHQDMGKAMTYARRYALGAMIGIAPEKDVDGVGAAPSGAVSNRHPNAPREESPRQQEPIKTVTPPTKTLAQRADMFESAMKACDNKEALTRTWKQGGKVCADLDLSDPERLVETTALYDSLMAKFDGVDQTEAHEVFE